MHGISREINTKCLFQFNEYQNNSPLVCRYQLLNTLNDFNVGDSGLVRNYLSAKPRLKLKFGV